MDPEILAALGLDAGADKAAVLSALSDREASLTALQTSLNSVRGALELKDDADSDALITALNSRLTVKPEAPKVSEGDNEVAELKETVLSLQSKLETTVTTHAKAAAVKVVDQAIEDFKIAAVLRDHYITRHMKDPDVVEKEFSLMPSLHAGGLAGHKPLETKEGELSSDDQHVVALMGLDPEAFAKTAKNTQLEQF